MKDAQLILREAPGAIPPNEGMDNLARMSHELRTPLNVVLGALELTLKTALTAEQQEYLAMMRTAGNSLLCVVNQILDYSRLEAGAIDMERIPFSPRRCLGDTLQMLAIEAARKGLTLRCEVDPALPETLLGDPMRLRQIVTNLLANAIKFTDRGEIVVRATLEAEAEDTLSCHFSVRDRGIGIAPERQAGIFSAYRQADASTARLYGGSGLGLSIAARLVSLMQGEIWLDSTPGQGSTFHFTACFDRSPEQVPGLPEHRQDKLQPSMDDDRLLILLVEDDPLNRRLAQITLEQAGHQVMLAENGRQAGSLLDTCRPDVILMDVQMPDMDGFTAAAAIRCAEQAHGQARVPILALSADLSIATQQRCREAGMDGSLAKPVDPAALLRALGNLAQAQDFGQPEVVDRQSLLERIHGDPQLLAEIRELFQRNSRRNLAALRQELADHRRDVVLSRLHTLRGMCRSLSAPAAQAAVDALEAACLARRQSAIAGALARLENAFQALGEALGALSAECRPVATQRLLRRPASPITRTGPRPSATQSNRSPAREFRPRLARTAFRRIAA